MNFKSIRLRDFRNIQYAEIKSNPGLSVFVGDNAQGKSNFLEAVSLLTSGSSFRSVNHFTDFIKTDSQTKTALLNGIICTNSGHNVLENAVDIQLTDQGKEIFIIKKRTTRVELAKKFGLVTFTPESLNLIKSGPSERRSMLDELSQALDHKNINLQAAFIKALKSRNALLKKYKEGESVDWNLVDSMNENYLPLAVKMTYARITATRQILPYVEKIFRLISDEKNAEISLDYVISGQCAIDWTENKVYDEHLSRLKHLKGAEIASGQTLVGPHKHDVVIRLNRRDARYFCSQGQQRAITLSFKISQIEAFRQSLGENPILILDDVLSELDIDKQHKLVDLLRTLEGQIFMSTTNLDHIKLFGNKKYEVYKIINGELKD